MIEFRSYQYYSDPGHAWLKVDQSEIDALQIADKISPYSYRQGQTVYLEEDIDSVTFFKALHSRFYPELDIDSFYRDILRSVMIPEFFEEESFIRRLPRY